MIQLSRALPLFYVLSALTATGGELVYPACCADGVHRVRVTDEALARSPAWDEEEDNPPLSARKALRLAGSLLTEYPASPGARWELETLTLRRHGKRSPRWFWLATYTEAWPNGTGVPARFIVPVLMDGAAVRPDPERWKSDYDAQFVRPGETR